MICWYLYIPVPTRMQLRLEYVKTQNYHDLMITGIKMITTCITSVYTMIYLYQVPSKYSQL